MLTNTPKHIRPPSKRKPSVLSGVACCCGIIASALLFVATSFAVDPPSLEYRVKGAFLVKFGLFVEWPEAKWKSDSAAPFTIGILGEDPFGSSFDEAVKKEKVGGRPVVVKRAETAEELHECQIVFVGSSEMERMSVALSQLSTSSILTVGDSPGFARAGGMIGFIKEDGKVRFEINKAVAEKAGLKPSSKLLQVSKIVAGEKPIR